LARNGRKRKKITGCLRKVHNEELGRGDMVGWGAGSPCEGKEKDMQG